jgi:lipoprotein-anchoring transpeptidase ErfK/SrfK
MILVLFFFLIWFDDGKGDRISLHLSKREFTLYVMQGDSILHRFPVALGKVSGDKEQAGDNRTPEGKFRISKIHNSQQWVYDFKDGKGPIAGAYGPWFLRLETAAETRRSGKSWAGIGIHGTHDPASIGTPATEGCIRLRNDHLEVLRTMVRPGTPVTIRE